MRDHKSLTAQQVTAWEKALDLFVAGLQRGRFEPGLRVKRVQGYPGVWEMTWAPDGRATFEYGDELHAGGAAHHLAPHRHTRHLPPAVSGPFLQLIV